MWDPITIEELNVLIISGSKKLDPNQSKFWSAIKIVPEKWTEADYGEEGGGFWVVGIFGKRIIWYNDIEEGFNVSDYTQYGIIDEYGAEQDELNWCINKILK